MAGFGLVRGEIAIVWLNCFCICINVRNLHTALLDYLFAR